ncbi:SCO family protein [bacterium]|nr:SCO family protein [bacterium]
MSTIVLGAALALFGMLGCERASSPNGIRELPRMAPAPEFSLTDSVGEEFVFSETAGRVRVVNFFFARCPSICPRIQEQLSQLRKQHEAREDLLFLSLSVDPEHDTPEVLGEYARKYRKNSEEWKFLTGDLTTIEGLLANGFRLSSGMLPDEHNTRIVLVDGEGVIRGFYQGMDKEHIKRLGSDLEQLLSE